MTPMRTLFRENRVISSIGAELDHKSCWEILSDPEIAGRYFDHEACHCFQRHVLWTRVLSDRRTALPTGESGDLLEFARREHETLVLKPSRGYGGDGVLIGQTVGAAEEWERALDAALADPGLWVVQSPRPRCPCWRCRRWRRTGRCSPRCTTTSWATRRTPTGSAILARASQREVVNVAQRGGMAAVMVVIGWADSADG